MLDFQLQKIYNANSFSIYDPVVFLTKKKNCTDYMTEGEKWNLTAFCNRHAFSRDNSNYLNHNKMLIVSRRPSASFLQIQSQNRQAAFKINRDSLQSFRNMNGSSWMQ